MLYASGMTYQEVADELGYESLGGAYKAVQRALKKRAEESYAARDELIAKHMEIIRLCVRGQMPAVVKGNQRAVEVVLKALEREAKLMGLDRPIVVDARVTDAMTAEIDELVQQFELLAVQQSQAEANRERG